MASSFLDWAKKQKPNLVGFKTAGKEFELRKSEHAYIWIVKNGPQNGRIKGASNRAERTEITLAGRE
jgi:hypothetical protein